MIRQEYPNIIFIMTDQQRFDSLGCYGFKGVSTPNLDKLASEGMLFDNCYVNNPICTPSRASIFTGKHLPGHGVYKLHDRLPEEEVLFTKKLQEQGYETALFGKLHVSGRIYEKDNRHPNDGFDIYEWCMEPSIDLDSPFNGYSKWLQETDPNFYERLKREGRNLIHVPKEVHMTHWAAERTINYINEKEGNKPFFCMMSVFDPHNPYEDYPLEMLKYVNEDEIPIPIDFDGSMVDKPDGLKQEQEHSYLGDFKDYSLEEIKKMRVGYYASIALIDIEVGRVLGALEEKGIDQNTVVIFVSDHGDMLGDHQLFVKGAYFYDPCVKVPLIIRWPEKIEAGIRTSHLVQPHDLAATILNIAGYSQAYLDLAMPESRNVIELAKEDAKLIHDYVVCCYRNTGISDKGEYHQPKINATMLRNDRFKLNVYHQNEVKNGIQGEVFDMQNDKNELHNLWNHKTYQGEKERLLGQLMNWMLDQESALGSRGGEAIPKKEQRMVNSLK